MIKVIFVTRIINGEKITTGKLIEEECEEYEEEVDIIENIKNKPTVV